ncbi:hypothetical protein ACIOBK_33875 [Micromonospora chokoriensis]
MADRRSISAQQRATLLAAPAFVTAALGVGHPGQLDTATAPRWLTVHLVLLFATPLLALAPIAVCRHAATTTPNRAGLGWVAVLSGAIFGICYATLDVLAGIATGQLVSKNLATDERSPAVLAMQQIAAPFGTAGAAALVCCVLVASYAAWQTVGEAAISGSLLAVAGAWGLGEYHVYWPHGVVALLCLGLGQWLLAARILEGLQPLVLAEEAGGPRRSSAG